MKILVSIARILVGFGLLLTGFFKANDPIGYGYKLEALCRIFEIPLFIPITPYLAVIFSFVFLMLGLLILFGLRLKTALWTSLVIAALNTYISYHLASSGQMPWGPLFAEMFEFSPWQQFSAEISLFILLIILLAGAKNISPIVGPKLGNAVLITLLFVCLGIPVYTFRNLPLLDFSMYKSGCEINQTINENIEKNKPSRISKLTILDTENKDIAKELFQNKSFHFLLISYDLKEANISNQSRINDFAGLCEKDHVSFTGMTADGPQRIDEFRHEVQAAYPYCTADTSYLKTIIRSNPGLVLLEGSKIIAKWPHRDIPSYHLVKSQYFKKR